MTHHVPSRKSLHCPVLPQSPPSPQGNRCFDRWFQAGFLPAPLWSLDRAQVAQLEGDTKQKRHIMKTALGVSLKKYGTPIPLIWQPQLGVSRTYDVCVCARVKVHLNVDLPVRVKVHLNLDFGLKVLGGSRLSKELSKFRETSDPEAPDVFRALKQPGFETPKHLWGVQWRGQVFH